MAKKIIHLQKGEKQVKNLPIGETVTINHHDYYYKGVQDVTENGLMKKRIAFWSTKTDFKKYFNLSLLEHVVREKAEGGGYDW